MNSTSPPTFAPSASNTGTIATAIVIITALIIVVYAVFFDVSLGPTGGVSKSEQGLIANTFATLFFCLLATGIAVYFLPSLAEFRGLMAQSGNVTWIVAYTIFAIFFYTYLLPQWVPSGYTRFAQICMALLGVAALWKGFTSGYVEKFNVNYERIKMLIIVFCCITFLITTTNSPGSSAAMSEIFGGKSLSIAITAMIFAFLYLLVLLMMPDVAGSAGAPAANMFQKMSGAGIATTAGFAVFLAITTILLGIYRDKLFGENAAKTVTVVSLLLIICVLWIGVIGIQLFSSSGSAASGASAAASSQLLLIKRGLSMLFGLVTSAMFIYWLTYSLQHLAGGGVKNFVLTAALVAVMLAMMYRTMRVQLPSATGNIKKNAVFSLLQNTVLYIPCFISGIFEQLGRYAGGEDRGSLAMLGTAVILWIAYFAGPKVVDRIQKRGGKQLVPALDALSLSVPNNLGTYFDLIGRSSDDTPAAGGIKYDYRYAISAHIFVDSAAPNTGEAYSRYATLLNFGGKPCISYNVSTHSLRISTRMGADSAGTGAGDRVLYETRDTAAFPLQKWNHVILNYSGGTVDVFINGTLVQSNIEVVPYYSYDALVSGETDGIAGGIRDVVFFNHELTANEMYALRAW